MARIAGVDLPREKKLEIGLTYIFGIGRATAQRILQETGVSADQRVRDLNDADTNRLRQAIEKDYRVEGALRTETAMNIKRLMDIGSYRGNRHRRGLPVRGQRTHTNARTKKGPRRAIAGKKKVTK
ncbi:MAG TPA: 30S ribosomal protein S13 [Gemmatimonadaceae bacterium]|jgi:small subunit ribosomal protein S13|nr:30S ribosomal protein S13 [Gemmatimonadaceae bacterium]